jgi:N6-L-threonylcarbamoyladenine synthase
MEGHIVASAYHILMISYEIPELEFPVCALLISGGHTELVRISEMAILYGHRKDKDDAVGEAFDKVARLLDLPYPGGPQISKLGRTCPQGRDCR